MGWFVVVAVLNNNNNIDDHAEKKRKQRTLQKQKRHLEVKASLCLHKKRHSNRRFPILYLRKKFQDQIHI